LRSRKHRFFLPFYFFAPVQKKERRFPKK
jgi:hypothetical protein